MFLYIGFMYTVHIFYDTIRSNRLPKYKEHEMYLYLEDFDSTKPYNEYTTDTVEIYRVYDGKVECIIHSECGDYHICNDLYYFNKHVKPIK